MKQHYCQGKHAFWIFKAVLITKFYYFWQWSSRTTQLQGFTLLELK